MSILYIIKYILNVLEDTATMKWPLLFTPISHPLTLLSASYLIVTLTFLFHFTTFTTLSQRFFHGVCVSKLFVFVTIIPDKNNLEKIVLFSAPSFRGQHGQQNPLLWVWVQAEHCGRREWKRKATHLSTAVKQKEGERSQGQNIIHKCIPPVTYFLQPLLPAYVYHTVVHSNY